MIEYIILGVVVFVFLCGVRIVRPTEKALIETMGKYQGFGRAGFNWIVPIFQRMVQVNTTEMMEVVEPQEIITKDNLNAKVDLVIYYKVGNKEEEVKKSVYEVNDFESQIITLAQTTARNVIGSMDFVEVNSQRQKLNDKLRDVMNKECSNWGVKVVRVELKEITPPKDVQDTMNKVIKAENEKTAAINLANAMETQADGRKRADIKEAEGIARGKIIVAEGEAQRIKLVNEAANKYFVGNAQKLRQLEVTQESLKNNSKIVLTEKGINTSIILGNIPTEK
jgi:regulator of protease activity HflC (stomatin/prohibitin superfamily)